MARLPNGPEFIPTTLATWTEAYNIELEFIQPGKPNQNSYIERFNRTYSTEILDMYAFKTLTEVRELTDNWITSSSLNDLIPWEYLIKYKQTENSNYGCRGCL